MNIKDVVDLVIYVAAALAAISTVVLFLRKFLISPIKKALKEEITDLVKEIHDQVTPNGGGSLKDDVTATRRILDIHVTEEMPRAWRTLDQLIRRFDKHITEHHSDTQEEVNE